MHLAKRRLQAEENEAIGSNETYVIPLEEIPSNGCNICQGATFMPDIIPNQNFVPGLEGTTCGEWQNDILPMLLPTGENCRSDLIYRELFVSCCRVAIPRYQCEQNVHKLISSREDYNIAVPPIVSHDKPLVVTTDITFEYAEDINVMSGTATILVSISFAWRDPRLAWTVDNEDTCADFINMWTGYGQEETAIWTPDFDLLNQKEGLQSFPASLATVSSDGMIQWSVSGAITAMCQFHGLSNIPYDTLGCQFLFGARSRQNANLVFYEIANYNRINVGRSDMQYSEFIPVPEMFEKGYTWYFNNDYAQAQYYNFFFRRARNFYLVNIVIPTIIFTYCSFCTFLLDMRVGERLGFGMALALVIVAAQIVTFDLVPVSNRKLWINKLVAWSFYWVFAVLIQSVGVGFIYFLREDHKAKHRDRRLSRMTVQHRNGMAEAASFAMRQVAGDNDDDSMREKSISNFDLQPKQPWFFMYSLRKFDYICMAISIVSYSGFILYMFSSNKSGSWVQDESEWYTYSSNYGPDEYENQASNPHMDDVLL